MIKCLELNQEFATKRGMFKALKANKDKIIKAKKSAIKHSEASGCSFSINSTLKGIDGLEGDFVYPIINTTLYRDSHKDVHFNGIWNKSIQEQVGKIHYVTEHELKLENVIAYPNDLEMMVKTVSWRDIGKDFDGETQALIFKINKNLFPYSNKNAVDVIKNRRPAQNSVRMKYVKIDLAIDDSSEEFSQEKALYDKNINSIANKQEVSEDGYYWAVTEAKIQHEGSMVLLGSNDATPIIYGESIEPSKGTQGDDSDAAKAHRKKHRWH